MELTLFTWGYQRRYLNDLQRLVVEYGIEAIVDVRANPNSRRPEWVKESLERAFSGRYRWIGWLGNKGYYGGADGARLINEESGLMEFEAFVKQTGARRVLLLCYEEDAAQCHRSIVAAAIANRIGTTRIEHLS